MLKSYNATLVSGAETVICSAAEGHEIAIVTIEIASGSSDGNITLSKNNGSADVFSEVLRIKTSDAVIIDSKIFLPAGYSLKALANVDGIQISVSGDDSEV